MTLRPLFFVLVMIALVATGCSRQRHRLRADRDAYSLIRQKNHCAPWDVSNFQVDPLPGSRLAHGSCADDPCLPSAAPSLYAFQVPETVERPASRFSNEAFAEHSVLNETLHDLSRTMLRFPPRADAQEVRPNGVGVQLANFQQTPALGAASGVAVAFLPVDDEDPAVPPLPTNSTLNDSKNAMRNDAPRSGAEVAIVPIAEFAWSSIPKNCLMRTIEFGSVQQEYERTFKTDPGDALFDSAERLALEDLLQLAVQHSREYQTQKESLYRTALRLSLERYAFQLKFTPTGNGTDVDWLHDRSAGITENRLGVASGAAVEKVLATGGNLLARFANDVVLTFNGPTGFATDIGSELFAELTQPLLQRDVVFESLTQAERDLVYAARDYARFRKQFFRDIASDYYRLLLTYRSIEIDMLDYFANQRGFDQSKYEYELLGKIPRFQVDQFEQNTLNSRSRVIRSCNQLEESFDLLKLRLGIPPETPINLELTELEMITARDEVTVASELCARSLRNLERETQKQSDPESQED